MESSSIGFVIGVLVGILVVFLAFGFNFTFTDESQLNIALTIIFTSLTGFGLGWLFEGVRPKY